MEKFEEYLTKIDEAVTVRDCEAIKKAEEEAESSPEYMVGLVKLNVDHRLAGGRLVASEDKDGLVRVSLIPEKGESLDLSSFLPKGVRFVTPAFMIKNHPGNILLRGESGSWGTDRALKLIMVGDMHNPRSLFCLFHEIGHACQKEKDVEKEGMDSFWKEASSGVWGLTFGHRLMAQIDSKDERNAWARGIRIARTIRRGTGIDLFSLFRDKEDFQGLVYGSLVSHRYGRILHLAEDFLMKGGRAGSPPGPEELEYYGKLFDKGKLK